MEIRSSVEELPEAMNVRDEWGESESRKLELAAQDDDDPHHHADDIY